MQKKKIVQLWEWTSVDLSETLGFVGLYWVELSVCIIPPIIYNLLPPWTYPVLGEQRKSACLCFICVCFQSSMHNKLCFIVGIPTGDVLIIAHWRLSTLTQYLTWFDKSPTSMGEVHIIRYREKNIIQIHGGGSHPLYSTPISHCCHCSPSLFLSSCLLSLTLTHIALQIMPLFIGNNSKTRSIKHGTNYATTCASTLYQVGDELFHLYKVEVGYLSQ